MNGQPVIHPNLAAVGEGSHVDSSSVGGYLLVLPAVGGKGVVFHLHGEVQPGEGVTQSHPERRGIAGHCRHGGHFLPVPSSTLHEGTRKWCE